MTLTHYHGDRNIDLVLSVLVGAAISSLLALVWCQRGAWFQRIERQRAGDE